MEYYKRNFDLNVHSLQQEADVANLLEEQSVLFTIEDGGYAVDITVVPKEIAEDEQLFFTLGEETVAAEKTEDSCHALIRLAETFPYELRPIVTIVSPDGRERRQLLKSADTNLAFELNESHAVIPPKFGKRETKILIGYSPANKLSAVQTQGNIESVTLQIRTADGSHQVAMEYAGQEIPEEFANASYRVQAGAAQDLGVLSKELYRENIENAVFEYYTVSAEIPDPAIVSVEMVTKDGLVYDSTISNVDRTNRGEGCIYPDEQK